MNQSALADDLGKHRSSISRALNETGPVFSKLQMEIIERLTPYAVEEEVGFRLVRRRATT